MEKKPSNIIKQLSARKNLEPIDFKMMLTPSRVIDLKSTVKNEALEELIELIVESGRISDEEAFRRAIFEREKLLSTGVGNGVGLPHVKIRAVTDFVMAVGRSHEGIDYGSQDGKPVYLIIMIGANDSQSTSFLKVLARLMMKLKNPGFRDSIAEAETCQMIHKLITGEVKSA